MATIEIVVRREGGEKEVEREKTAGFFLSTCYSDANEQEGGSYFDSTHAHARAHMSGLAESTQKGTVIKYHPFKSRGKSCYKYI